MSHMAPYNRMTHPNIGPPPGGPDLPQGPGVTGGGAPNSSGASNPKKRRKNANANSQPPAAMQDLLPPPLSGFGDTIVASNPFDDCPPSMLINTRASNAMGMNMGMGPLICRPMAPQQHLAPSGQPMGPILMGQGGPMPMPPSGPPMNGMPPMGPNMGGQPMMRNPRWEPVMMGAMGPMGGPHGHGMGPGGNGPGGMMNMAGPNGMNGPQPMVGPGGQLGGPSGPGGPMNGQYNCQHNNNFMMNPMNSMYPKPMPVSAGKIYPADQPMVFNAQNPNAPPIYPCGVCHKEVHDNDQAILCESGCNFWFHRGCTGLTEAAFQLLTQEVYAEWVCDKCLSSKNIPLVKFKP